MTHNFTYNEEIKFGILEWFDDIPLCNFQKIYKNVLKYDLKYIIVDLKNTTKEIYKDKICEKIHKIEKAAIVCNYPKAFLYNIQFNKYINVKAFSSFTNACEWMFKENKIINHNPEVVINTYFNYAEVTWINEIKTIDEFIKPLALIANNKHASVKYVILNDKTNKINKNIPLIKKSVDILSDIIDTANIQLVAINSNDSVFYSIYKILYNNKIPLKFFSSKNKALGWILKNQKNERL